MALLTLLCAACGDTGPPPPPVSGARRLEILDPPGFQIGLHYDESIELPVRVVTDSDDARPIADVEVRFAIFGDPKGSTLSGDRARTNADGVAMVRLSAGRSEASFQVSVVSDFADAVQFAAAVSTLDFVSIDALLDYDGARSGDVRGFIARLYDDHSCAQLSAYGDPPATPRTLSQPAPGPATLAFTNLLSMPYALMARAENSTGGIVAYGCLDLAAGQLTPGSELTIPVPMIAVAPSFVGSFSLSTALSASPSLLEEVVAPWRALTSCPYGAAQRILDEIAAQASMPIASAIAQHRGAVDGAGCRPATAMSSDSLDKRLHAVLVAAPGAPAAFLGFIRDGLEAIVAHGTLSSTIAIGAPGSAGTLAEHRLTALRLEDDDMTTVDYDLNDYGKPRVEAHEVLLAPAASSLLITSHGFTLGYRSLWRRALFDLEISPVVALAEPTVEAFTTALIGASTYMSETGCAAIEQLVCDVTGVGACALLAACNAAQSEVAAELDAPFIDPVGLDFVIEGSALGMDSDGDLAIDTLTGAFATPFDPSSAAPFSGARSP